MENDKMNYIFGTTGLKELYGRTNDFGDYDGGTSFMNVDTSFLQSMFELVHN